jgi:hypothetical protein
MAVVAAGLFLLESISKDKTTRSKFASLTDNLLKQYKAKHG